MKIRYIQKQSTRLRIFTNEVPDKEMGPYLKVDNERFVSLMSIPRDEWESELFPIERRTNWIVIGVAIGGAVAMTLAYLYL